MKRKYAFLQVTLVAIILSVSGLFFYLQKQPHPDDTVRIAIFVGGRTVSVYRAIMDGRYKAAGVDVTFVTKNLFGSNKEEGLDHSEYKSYVNDEAKQILDSHRAAKARGDDLADLVLAGKADAATIGESSFLKLVAEGAPLVAVAVTGYDSKKYPGHAIVLRKDLKIRGKRDLKGKRFVVRRSSGGDVVFFREFLLAEGLDPDKDVILLDDNAPDNQFRRLFQRKKVDGAYGHLRPVVQNIDLFRIYRPLNWVNAELSQALLVFRRDFLEQHPRQVEGVVEGFIQQNLYELSLPKEKRCRIITEHKIVKIPKSVIQINFNGQNLPVMDKVPLVKISLLEEMQRLMVKHKFIKKSVDLKPFIDNRFVERVRDRLKIVEDGNSGECY